jgi:DNA-binding protein YbaB
MAGEQPSSEGANVSAEMELLIAEFEKFQSKVKQAELKFADVGRMQEELARLEAVATSPDRSVRVTVGPGGAVKDIQLGPDAMRQQPGALAATIMSTLQAAVVAAARREAQVVDNTVGSAFGVNTTEQVLQAQATALGTTVEELTSQQGATAPHVPLTPPAPPAPFRPVAPPAAQPSQRPNRPAQDGDDDFSQGSIYDEDRF